MGTLGGISYSYSYSAKRYSCLNSLNRWMGSRLRRSEYAYEYEYMSPPQPTFMLFMSFIVLSLSSDLPHPTFPGNPSIKIHE
ncbi:hypothetical protein L21SP4_02252 [Kiritimatiella glycovorans]|uniref:Uncharacterized protein n=1 Tax=Kiritimatiella glycovorans TaxID=1307763 RepID=A0A0G3EMX4_9BACT|nr:hypothetical protein L21SP4_02252 [Kiritimatiella glycovorans]